MRQIYFFEGKVAACSVVYKERIQRMFLMAEMRLPSLQVDEMNHLCYNEYSFKWKVGSE